MEKPSLADLEAFAVVAAERNFQRAAGLMGVSRSALSHRIRKLEEKVGLRLLNRTTRSVSPTNAGARLLESIRPILINLDAAIDALGDERSGPGGTLRINADKRAAQLMLEHILPVYLERYPDVEIDLVCDGRFVDIVEHGFDAGLRLAEAVPQDMIGVRLGDDFRFLAVATPGYLKRFGHPMTPADLCSHCAIRQRLPSGKRYRWEFERRGQEIALDPPGALTLNDNTLIAEAALIGLGIAYLPEPAVRDHLAAGRLVAVLEDWCPRDSGLMLYYPGHRHVPAALRALIGLIREPLIRSNIV